MGGENKKTQVIGVSSSLSPCRAGCGPSVLTGELAVLSGGFDCLREFRNVER